MMDGRKWKCLGVVAGAGVEAGVAQHCPPTPPLTPPHSSTTRNPPPHPHLQKLKKKLLAHLTGGVGRIPNPFSLPPPRPVHHTHQECRELAQKAPPPPSKQNPETLKP